MTKVMGTTSRIVVTLSRKAEAIAVAPVNPNMRRAGRPREACPTRMAR